MTLAEEIVKENSELPDATLLVISALAGSSRFSNNSERAPVSSMCTNLKEDGSRRDDGQRTPGAISLLLEKL
jgi:hypothetical protein